MDMKPDEDVGRVLNTGKDFGGFSVTVLHDLTETLMGWL